MTEARTTTGNGKKATAAKAAAKKPAAAAAKKIATAMDQPAKDKPAKRAAARAARPQVDTQSVVTAEERQRMIAEAAYLRAERRGFNGGDPTDDWLSAEREIDQILSRT